MTEIFNFVTQLSTGPEFHFVCVYEVSTEVLCFDVQVNIHNIIHMVYVSG